MLDNTGKEKTPEPIEISGVFGGGSVTRTRDTWIMIPTDNYINQ